MNNLNSVLIEGNLTSDPQEKNIEGNTLSSFSIASNRYFKKNGEQTQETSFFNVDVWGKNAEYCNKYLKKGSGVRVVGRLKQDRWTDTDDKIHYSVKIIAEHVDFFPKKNSGKAKDNTDSQDEVQEEKEEITIS